MTQIIKEPIVWFVLVALVLFMAEGAITPDQDPIILNDKVTTRISALWAAQMRRPPSQEELNALVDDWVNEEMFYREALRLSLDRNDTIVRRRLVQKYNFLMEELDEQGITEKEMLDFYQSNLKQYQLEQRITFSNILFRTGEDAVASLDAIAKGGDWRALGIATLLPGRYVKKTIQEIGYALGPEFASGIADITENTWSGPVISSYGYHLIKIENRLPAETIPFESITDKIHYDLIKKKAEINLQLSAEALRSRYPLIYE
jgi:hypothetical protein